MIFLCRPVLPLLSYVINYDYIVKELCINKDKINTECNGKCHLKKELAEASGTPSGTHPQQKSKHLELDTLYFNKIDQLVPSRVCPDNRPAADTYCLQYTFTAHRVFLHPPARA